MLLNGKQYARPKPRPQGRGVSSYRHTQKTNGQMETTNFKY